MMCCESCSMSKHHDHDSGYGSCRLWMQIVRLDDYCRKWRNDYDVEDLGDIEQEAAERIAAILERETAWT